jgi:hypothetical protein
MRKAFFSKLPLLIISLCGLFWFSSAQALVRIQIDLSAQRMQVEADGGTYSWPISTARSGYVTPRGSFAPQSLQRMHYSHKYHMSPMPYSIFFLGGYAIHGTYETAYLGRPASHGCVRLSTDHAAILFHMVQAEGARISISGAPPRTQVYARGGERHRHIRTVAAAQPRPDQGYGFPFGGPQRDSTGPSGWQSNSSW